MDYGGTVHSSLMGTIRQVVGAMSTTLCLRNKRGYKIMVTVLFPKIQAIYKYDNCN